MPSVVDPSSRDFPHFALPRYPLDKKAAQGSEWGEKPWATVFRPFFTVFDRFRGPSESKFARRIKHSTVFAGRAAAKKR